MGKIWDELERAGIEYAVSADGPFLHSCMAIKSYVNWDASFSMDYMLMTSKQVHIAAQEMVEDVEKYREFNIGIIRRCARRMPADAASSIQSRIDHIGRMTRGETLVGMPKFIRVCLELLDRGHKLEDMFYDKPH